MNVEFKDPGIFLLIPIVYLLIFWFKQKNSPPSIRFSSTDLLQQIPRSARMRFLLIPFLLRLLAMTLILAALARPRIVLEEIQSKTLGIDILLTIDVSSSMLAEDFVLNGQRMNRVEVVKKVVKEFIEGRTSDRLGLVTFAQYAYTLCPLTLDHQWLKSHLERVKIGLIEDGTAVGSAIATSVARLKGSSAKSKVIILLTDGINNAGKIDPLRAAQLAKALGIKIYTIGAGTKGYAPVPVTDLWGRKYYQRMLTDIDEVTLKGIAAATGGVYYRASNSESLQEIYKEIDTLEKIEMEEPGYKDYKELFAGLVHLSWGLIFLELFLSNTILLRIP